MVGTGSAALTGLVFVALTINLKEVARDATHRYRAINMLSGFTAAFLLSAVAVMGSQTYRSLGIEWLLVSAVAAGVNTNGYIQGLKSAGSRYALTTFRIVGGSLCYLAMLIGSTMICFGSGAGVSVLAIAVLVNFGFLISGSWLLIVGPPTADEV